MEIFHILVLASLSLLLLNYLLNLRVFSFPANLTPPSSLPLLSVLIPARNEEKRIGPCLESLLASDYPHLEILVLDDHSSDGTAKCLRLKLLNPAGTSPALHHLELCGAAFTAA